MEHMRLGEDGSRNLCHWGGTGGTEGMEDSGWPVLPVPPPTTTTPLPQAALAGFILSVCSPCLAELVADAGQQAATRRAYCMHTLATAESVPLHLLKEARTLFCCVPRGPSCQESSPQRLK